MSDIPNTEVHISSIIVQCKPEDMPDTCSAIAEHKFAEVNLTAPEGKIIVTLETPSRREVTNAIDDFRQIKGVLNVTMVYHQMENADCMDELYEPDEPIAKKMETTP